MYSEGRGDQAHALITSLTHQYPEQATLLWISEADMRAANGLRQSLEDLPGSLIRHVAEPNMGKEDLLKLWFGEPDVNNSPTTRRR